MEEILLSKMTKDGLLEEIRNIIVQEVKSLLKTSKTNNDDELLTRKDVCRVLKISQSTLIRWTRSGRLQVHLVGNKVYYYRSEIYNQQ